MLDRWYASLLETKTAIVLMLRMSDRTFEYIAAVVATARIVTTLAASVEREAGATRRHAEHERLRYLVANSTRFLVTHSFKLKHTKKFKVNF